ncbi:MAG: flagellar brake protein [Phycisphaerae bacterium]
MSTVLTVEPTRRDQALDEAVSRNVPIVLSVRDGVSWAVHKSRFLGSNRVAKRLYIECPPPAAPESPPPEVRRGEAVGVAFRRGHKKCVFTAVMLGQEDYGPDGGSPVPALALSWPDSLQELQRRAYYRVSVPPHKTVKVELWQGGAACRKKAGSAEWPSYTGRLMDLSAGGMCLVLPPNRNPRLDAGDAVGLEFQPEPGGPAFLLNGLVRYVDPAPDGATTVGLQFVGLEATVENRKVLQQLLRVVNQYYRFELRRLRPPGRRL